MQYAIIVTFFLLGALVSCDKGQDNPKVGDQTSTGSQGSDNAVGQSGNTTAKPSTGSTASGTSTTTDNSKTTGNSTTTGTPTTPNASTTSSTGNSTTSSTGNSTTSSTGNSTTTQGTSGAVGTSQISGGKAVIPFKAGRFAVSHDGNQHDNDDFGASAAILQMTKAGGRTANLVHFEINNHLGNNNTSMAAEMRASVKAAGFDTSPVYFDIDGGPGATAAQKHLTAEIEKSTPADPLYIIAAGPMSTVASALLAATKGTENTLVISHSGWNNSHKDTPQLLYTWSDIKSPKVQISDQNAGLGGGMTRSITDPVIKARDIKGDISDAGMYLYLMTGHQNTSAQMVNDYINNKGNVP